MKFFMLDYVFREDDSFPLKVDLTCPGGIRIDCPTCGTIALMPAPVDIRVKVVDVAPLQDLEQVLSTLLVSRKFRDAVANADLLGASFRPVLDFLPSSKKAGVSKMIDLCKNEFAFQAIWADPNGASIEHSNGVRCIKRCTECGWEEWSLPTRPLDLDSSQWHGADFFQIRELPGPVFMTERAMEVLSAAGLSNFCAKPAEEYRPGFL